MLHAPEDGRLDAARAGVFASWPFGPMRSFIILLFAVHLIGHHTDFFSLALPR